MSAILIRFLRLSLHKEQIVYAMSSLSPIVYRQLARMLYILCQVPVVYRTNYVPLRYLSPIVLQAVLNSYTLFASHITTVDKKLRTPMLFVPYRHSMGKDIYMYLMPDDISLPKNVLLSFYVH